MPLRAIAPFKTRLYVLLKTISPHFLARAQGGGPPGVELRIAQQVYAISRLVPQRTVPEVATQTELLEDQNENVTQGLFTKYGVLFDEDP